MPYYEEYSKFRSLIDLRKLAKKALREAKDEYAKVCADFDNSKQRVDSLYQMDDSE